MRYSLRSNIRPAKFLCKRLPSPRLEDQKIILSIRLGKVIPSHQLVSGLAHLLHHNRLLDPMVGPIAVAVDDPHLRVRTQRTLQDLHRRHRMRNLVIHLQHQHRICASRWQTRIVRRPQHRPHIRQVLLRNPLADVFDCERINVLRQHRTRRPHSSCREHRKPSRPGANIRDILSRCDPQEIHHTIDLQLLVPVRILENGKITRVRFARRPLGLLIRRACTLRTSQTSRHQQGKNNTTDPHTQQRKIPHALTIRHNAHLWQGVSVQFRYSAPAAISCHKKKGAVIPAPSSFLADAYRDPPPARINSPVSQLESSEARNTATGAMSFGCPMRPSGVCDSAHLWKSLPIKPAVCTPSVSTIPGLIELTRIFFGPSSFDSVRVTESTAPLVAVYTLAVGGLLELATEPILIMLPPSGPKYFNASCELRISPSTLRSNILWNCASVTSPSGVNSYTPALFTSTSSRPNAFFVSANTLPMSSFLEKSPCTATALPPFALISATTLSAPSLLDA